jgi:hypothetical protein
VSADCHEVARQKPSTCTAVTLRVFMACCLIGQMGRPYVSDIPNKFDEALRVLKAAREVLGSNLNWDRAGPS